MQTEAKGKTELLVFEILTNISVAKHHKEAGRDIEQEMKDLFLQANELIASADTLPIEAKENYMNNPREQVEFYCRDFLQTFKERIEEINKWFSAVPDYNTSLNTISVGDNKIKQEFFTNDSLESLTLQDIALMANKLYYYLVNIFDGYISGGAQSITTNVQETPTRTVQVLLMYYTGIYEHLVKSCNSNYTKVSEVIAAVIGGNPRTINRIFNFIANKSSQHRNNPYRDKDIIEILLKKLRPLGIDTKELEKILSQLQ